MAHENDPPDDVTIPDTLYPCADVECERGYPAADLHWVPAWHGWYCTACIEGPGCIGEDAVGPSLAKWLLREY